MRRQRDREREEYAAKEACGLKWWEGSLPNNVIVALSARQLDVLVQQANAENRLVMLNMFTEDCYVCRSLHPKLKKIALDNPDMTILKVNGSSDALREVFARYHVTRVPYFKLIRGGKVRSSFSASLSPERLALLRAEIAAAKSPSFSDADNAAYSDWEC